MKSFLELKKNLKRDHSHLKTVKLAILGDTATQLLVQAIQGFGFETGYYFDVFEADYDQIDRQILDASSELYQFEPDFTLIFYSSPKLLQKFYKLDNAGKEVFAQKHIEHITSLYQSIVSSLKSKVLVMNYPEIDDAVFGNYANKTNLSFVYQLRRINLGIMDLSQKLNNLFIVDLSLQQGHFSADFMTDRKVYVSTDIIFSIDFLPYAAKNIVDVISATLGVFKKCIVLDLDNTLWGGIIGEDGIENIQIGDLGLGKAFTEFQRWLKELKQRGIILAVCSKNDENNAKEPFIKHPDMVLKLKDIAVFVANWENKADNIKYIQSILNIGFDAMVFFDDTPFERSMVKTSLPEITVPELPEDPVEYLPYLRSLNLFETASFTAEDGQRTKLYQEEAHRTIVQMQSANEDDFLAALNMYSDVKGFDKFNTPRVAQLTQRSNQFNLRTVRYTDEDISRLAQDNSFINISFTLADRFGEYGLISAVVLEKQSGALFIDTWIMSCRVLKRGMETFVLNAIVDAARREGIDQIIGEYIPTAKNGMVKEHYKNLGFKPVDSVDSRWQLKASEYQDIRTHISVKCVDA